MNKQYFEENNHNEITTIVSDLEAIKLNNALVKKVKYLNYDIDVGWISSIETVSFKAVINFLL